MSKIRYLNFDFEIKKKSGGILIEGVSNAAVVDRSKEMIHPKEWMLDNYKKNPVVLFDHGKDPAFGSIPVGKATEVGPTDKGLYTKIMMSNSKTEKISAVRDLVEEGILKTFSVGFSPTSADDSGDGIKQLKGCELLEQSIVPIPMNQDSMFAVASKRFATDNPTAKAWFHRHVTKLQLVQKGSWVAAAIHQAIYDQLETGQIQDREASLKAIADAAGVKMNAITSVLSGETTPVPPAIVDAFAKVLRLDKDFLVNLDKGDIALMDRVLSRNEQSTLDGGKGMAAKKTKDAGKDAGGAPGSMPAANETPPPPDPNSAEEQGETNGEEPKMVVYAVAIPKTMADSAEAASALAEQHGFKVDTVDENDTQWVISQRATDDLDMEEATMVDLGDGAIALAAPVKTAKASAPEADKAKKPVVPPASDTAKPGDNVDPSAEKPDPDESTDQGSGLDKATLDKLASDYKAEVSTVEADQADSVPAWVSDSALWEKAESASEEITGKVDYGLTVYIYLNQGGGKKSGAPAHLKGVDGAQLDDNPYLTLSRQTNVLLATLINETQIMSKKMDGLADLSVKLATTEGDGETSPPEEPVKGADTLTVKYKSEFAEYKEKIERGLKSMGSSV